MHHNYTELRIITTAFYYRPNNTWVLYVHFKYFSYCSSFLWTLLKETFERCINYIMCRLCLASPVCHNDSIFMIILLSTVWAFYVFFLYCSSVFFTILLSHIRTIVSCVIYRQITTFLLFCMRKRITWQEFYSVTVLVSAACITGLVFRHLIRVWWIIKPIFI